MPHDFPIPCLILGSNPELVFPQSEVLLDWGSLVISDQVRLGGLVGYIVVPGAVQILNLISEITAEPGKVPSHVS